MLEPLGWIVKPVTVDGVIVVPRPVMMMDCILRVREPSHAAQHAAAHRAIDARGCGGVRAD